MTTRAPGLTAAMRRALTDRTGCPFSNGGRMKRALQLRGLIDANGNRREARIQAALAAPRMTAAELDLLGRVVAAKVLYVRGGDVAMARKLARIRRDGSYFVSFDCATRRTFITPAGLTALNNMRAAMGSAEYREDLK